MNKSPKTTSIALGLACVWMGTHFGPGVASGTQINQYYVGFGIPGICVTVLAMCILGYALYCSMEFSRIYKAYDYSSWIQKLFGMKWVSILFDISFIVTCMTALGGSLNAIATLMVNELAINYWVGVGAVIVCCALLCAFGSKLVAAASKYMMYVVLAVLAMIFILVLFSGKMDFAGALANQATNLPKAGWLGAIWSAVIYASFQATVVANISSVANQLPNRSTSKKAAIFGITGNALMLIVMSIMLFGFTNVTFANGQNILGQSLPFYGILQELGYGWARIVYVITVFVAVLSTAVGFCFGGLARFSKYYRKGNEATPVQDIILVAVLLLVCAFCSKFGIVKLVSTGYTILGYLNLPILIIPAIFIGGRKISKKYLQANKIEAPGIDE
ncbi:MAG: hypothetical protein IJ507_01015 [Clostridia bacterium]|nr:hypothetical protein [Clostridia bacterium]